MGKWMLTIEGSRLFEDTEIEIAPLTIIAGLNSTGKSILARTAYALADKNMDELYRLWRHQTWDGSKTVKVSLNIQGLGKLSYSPIHGFEPSDYDPVNARLLPLLLPDYRILLRQALVDREELHKILDLAKLIKEFCNYIELDEQRDQCEKTASELKESLQSLYSNVLLPVNMLKKLKIQFREKDYNLVYSVYDTILNEAAKELRSSVKPGETVEKEDLFPLDMMIFETGSDEYNIEIVDERFTRGEESENFVPLDVVSSSIAATYTRDVVLYALAQPYKRILLVIEEPEETLAPPQQFVVGYLLGVLAMDASQKIRKEVRIILTTHSPYIMLGGLKAGARVYYTRLDRRTMRLVVEERPFAVFVLAEKLALAFSPK